MASEDGQRSDQSNADKRQEEQRVVVITRICRMMIPVLALSIPFFAMSRIGAALPFFAITAAALATFCSESVLAVSFRAEFIATSSLAGINRNPCRAGLRGRRVLFGGIDLGRRRIRFQ
jgi:hypothetical protein